MTFLPYSTVYRGARSQSREKAAVYVCRGASMERLLSPGPSQAVKDYTSFFEWGYEGTGPAQLSLAILLDYTRDREFALRYHPAFRRDFVAEWSAPRFQINGAEITAWLQRQGAPITADQLPM